MQSPQVGAVASRAAEAKSILWQKEKVLSNAPRKLGPPTWRTHLALAVAGRRDARSRLGCALCHCRGALQDLPPRPQQAMYAPDARLISRHVTLFKVPLGAMFPPLYFTSWRMQPLAGAAQGAFAPFLQDCSASFGARWLMVQIFGVRMGPSEAIRS